MLLLNNAGENRTTREVDLDNATKFRGKCTIETRAGMDVVFLNIYTKESAIEFELDMHYCTQLISALERAREEL